MNSSYNLPCLISEEIKQGKFSPFSTHSKSATHINITHNPDIPTNTNTTTVDTSGEDLVYTCPHCDRTFTSHIDLIGHLRIHRKETDEPVPGAPTYTRRIRLHCPHCPRTYVHRMSLFGHTPIHESGTYHNFDTPNASSTPAMSSPTLTPPSCASIVTSSTTPSASSTPTTLSPTHTLLLGAPATTTSTITAVDTDTADFSCPHSPRTFTTRIGLVGHLQIRRTETSEPVPGAPIYTPRIHLNCPHCTLPFMHCMSLIGHMRVHENLR
ncbi:hypothetical protein SprV_0301104300 [Sparganum proliferum]